MGKVCSKCKVEKDLSEFYKNKLSKDGLDYYCKDCRKKQTANIQKEKGYSYAKENRAFIESMKVPCEKCGEDRLYLIQFHHIDPKKKKFAVCTPGTRSKATIWEEIDKCVCLCSNCHDEFHYLYGKQPENPGDSLLEYLK